MSDWQPIETAPKDGTTVDLWSRRGRFYYDKWERFPDMWFAPVLNAWRNGKGDIQISDEHPTHWMPLPEPPA